jgi:ABC-type antimicrobial peptide transport system permease subunit
VYFLIPVVSLLAASAVFSSRNQLGETVETVVYSGASITVGYAVTAILGALMLTLHVGAITAQPDLLKSTVIGAAYPVVLATIAAFAVTFLRR